MSLRRPTTPAALTVAGLLAIGVFGASAAASASSVALHKSDVPAGYALLSQTLTNAGMVSYTGLPKAQFDSHGRITGLQNKFYKGGFTIISFVSQYKTAAGAQWEYGQSRASDLKHGKAVSAPRVGAQSTGFQQTATSGSTTLIAYGVDFLNGPYDMGALVAGPPGKVSISQAVHYAQIMVGRAH